MALQMNNNNIHGELKFEGNNPTQLKKKKSFWNLFRRSKKNTDSKLDLSKPEDIKKKLNPLDLSKVRVRSRSNFDQGRPSSFVINPSNRDPAEELSQIENFNFSSLDTGSNQRSKRKAPSPPEKKKKDANGHNPYMRQSRSEVSNLFSSKHLSSSVPCLNANEMKVIDECLLVIEEIDLESPNELSSFHHDVNGPMSMFPTFSKGEDSRPLPSLSSLLPPPPQSPPPDDIPIRPHPHNRDKSTYYNADADRQYVKAKPNVRKTNIRNSRSQSATHDFKSKPTEAQSQAALSSNNEGNDSDSSDANTPTSRRRFSVLASKSRSCKDLSEMGLEAGQNLTTFSKKEERLSNDQSISNQISNTQISRVPPKTDYLSPTRRTQTVSNLEINSCDEEKRFSTPAHSGKEETLSILELEKEKHQVAALQLQHKIDSLKFKELEEEKVNPPILKPENESKNFTTSRNSLAVTKSNLQRQPSEASTTSSITSIKPKKINVPSVKPKPKMPHKVIANEAKNDNIRY